MELEKLAELLRDPAHQKEINDNDFEKVIVGAYLKGGADAVKQMGKLFADAKLDLELYKNVVAWSCCS